MIKPADLLFVSNQHEGMDDAIVASTGNYVHVALVVDDRHIIDASPKYGVALRTLSDFLITSPQPDIFRPRITNPNQIVLKAKMFIGLPYNVSFYPEDKGMYCSEFITNVFKGTITFENQPLSFADGSQLISNYWLHYFNKLGVPAPVGQNGSNPTAMAKNEYLDFIGKLK